MVGRGQANVRKIDLTQMIRIDPFVTISWLKLEKEEDAGVGCELLTLYYTRMVK
jgi:hypothetical protein